jgi:uncharacterized membrane protein
MEARAKLVGHAIHPMLIVFPLGLLGMAAIFDLVFAFGGGAGFAAAAYYMIPAGIVTGWLGGELVERLHIGVDPAANPDAPSSLSSDPPVRMAA